MSLEDCIKDEYPLWAIEDKLVEAKRSAQNGNRQKCFESTERALEMLKESPKEDIDL